MDTVLVALGASLVGGFIIRRAAEIQPWRQVIQVMLALGATAYAFIKSGVFLAITVCVVVFILQGLLMAVFRLIGIRRLAKKMNTELDYKQHKERYQNKKKQ